MIEIFFGAIAGVVSSLGMGGGTILILLLTLFFNIDQHISQAINLIFFIPTSITAIIMNVKNKNINWKQSKNIVIYGIIGAIFGSIISNQLPSKKLKKIFGLFLGLIALFQIFQIYTSHNKNKKDNNKDKEKV